MQKIVEKMVAVVVMSLPSPVKGFCEMKSNSAITCQNQLELLDLKVKEDL